MNAFIIGAFFGAVVVMAVLDWDPFHVEQFYARAAIGFGALTTALGLISHVAWWLERRR